MSAWRCRHSFSSFTGTAAAMKTLEDSGSYSQPRLSARDGGEVWFAGGARAAVGWLDASDRLGSWSVRVGVAGRGFAICLSAARSGKRREGGGDSMMW